MGHESDGSSARLRRWWRLGLGLAPPPGVALRPSQAFRPGPGRTHRSGVTGLVARSHGLGGGHFAAGLPGTQSTFMAPPGRCCRRLRWCSYSLIRGAVCGGGRDLGSSDAARLRLAALGRGGGGSPATRPLGWAGPGGGWGRFHHWPCPRPTAGRCQGTKTLSAGVCLRLPSLRRWRLSREGRTQGLGHLEHSSAWTKNRRVWVTLGVRGRPRLGQDAGRRARLGHAKPGRPLELKLGECWHPELVKVRGTESH